MNQIIIAAFEGTLKGQGFTKKSGSWYLDKSQAILVAQLQKSQYGDKYYINLGIFLKALGDKQFPKEPQCHVRLRLCSVVGELLEKALDAECNSISDLERKTTIETAVRDSAIPLLLTGSSTEGLRELMNEGKFTKAFIHKDVKALTQR
jgi:hypothetical protein